MSKFIKPILILVIAAVVLLGFNLFSEKKDVSVSLKWKHQAQFAGMYVADDLGYYDKNGLNVTMKEFDFNSNQVDDLLSGKSDFVLLSAEEFLMYIDEGKDLKAVASFYQTSPYAIVTLKKSNIESPGDFLKKTLGNKGGKVEEEMFYLLLLEKFGITKDKVVIEKVGFDKREIDDLVDGDVDTIGLYRTDQLFFFEKEKIEYNIIYPEQYGFNISNDILVTTNSFFESDAELIEDFIESTVRGWEFAINKPEKAIESTMKYVVDDHYKDLEYEMYILENSIPLIKQGTSQKIGYLNPSSFEKLYYTMKANNFISTEFDISDFYTNEFIK